jgi:hypothetical protein
MNRTSIILSATLGVALSASAVRGQVIFTENFNDAAATDRWNFTGVDAGGESDFKVSFNWDTDTNWDLSVNPLNPTTTVPYTYENYKNGPTPSFDPIPLAPGSASGDPKRALRISVNDGGAAQRSGVNAFPRSAPNATTPLTVSGDYRFEGFIWHNYNGGAGGGSGSTEFQLYGISSDTTRIFTADPGSGTAAGTLGPKPNGVYYAAAGEGGAASSYQGVSVGQASETDSGDARYPNRSTAWTGASARVPRFDRANPLNLANTGTAAAPAMTFDTVDNPENPYYDQGATAPFPQYNATTQPDGFETYGSPGKGWVPFVIEQRGRIVTHSLNGKVINTTVLDTAVSGTPVVGLVDTFGGSIASPAFDNFVLVDNITLTNVSSSTTTYTGGGTWNNGAPASASTAAIYNAAAPETITYAGPTSVRSIEFAAGGHTLAGAGPITIGDVAAGSVIYNGAGSNTISAPLNFVNGVSIAVNPSSTLTLTQAVNQPNIPITKLQRGQLTMPAFKARSLLVVEGITKISGTGASKVEQVEVFYPTTDTTWQGQLDLGKTVMAVDYGTRTFVGGTPTLVTLTESPRARLAFFDNPDPVAGRIRRIFSSDWTSLDSAAQAASAFTYRPAFEASTIGIAATTSWMGTTIDATTVLIGYTFKADSNFDQAVNFNDLLVLAQNYNGTVLATEWWKGNTNGDTLVDFSDLLALAQVYGQSVSGSLEGTVTGSFEGDWYLAQSLVPEPTSLVALAGAGALLSRRRRA